MDTREAIELLRGGVTGYFYDEVDDDGIEHMREDLLASGTELHSVHWRSIKTSFETVLEHGTEGELNELVRRKFNRPEETASADGAREYLAYIYKSVFYGD